MVFTLLTEPETAKTLRIEVSTLRNARRRKKIRGLRQGNKWFYRPEYIEEYIKHQESESCAENLNLSNSKTNPEILNPIVGISDIMPKDAVNASLLGVKLARKTMKPR